MQLTQLITVLLLFVSACVLGKKYLEAFNVHLTWSLVQFTSLQVYSAFQITTNPKGHTQHLTTDRLTQSLAPKYLPPQKRVSLLLSVISIPVSKVPSHFKCYTSNKYALALQYDTSILMEWFYSKSRSSQKRICVQS